MKRQQRPVLSNDDWDIDWDKLWEISDRYIGDVPVSGDWNKELEHEQRAISTELGVSMDMAKELMIDHLEIPESAFNSPLAASTVIDEYDDPYDTNAWELLDRKSVPDSDVFYTDYCLYYNLIDGFYVTVFGDSDLYRPEDGYYDMEFENEHDAWEWFENYNGFEDNDIYSSADTKITIV